MAEEDDDLYGEIGRCFEPASDAVERTKARSLSARPHGRRGRSLLLAASFVTALVLVTVGFWIRRPAAPVDAEEMTAVFDGDVLLVRSASGRTWVVGPPVRGPQAPGDWLVAVQGEEK